MAHPVQSFKCECIGQKGDGFSGGAGQKRENHDHEKQHDY